MASPVGPVEDREVSREARTQGASRSRACTAPGCGRATRRLCVLSLEGSDTLAEGCEPCYLCEEVRRLAARLSDGDAALDTVTDGLTQLYSLARAAVADQAATEDVRSASAER